VKVVLKHFTIDPAASDPNTHKPLGTDGSWSIGKNRPAVCPEAASSCVEVFYAIPDQAAKCSWVISLDATGADGAILGENDDAVTYMTRTLAANEAAAYIKSRSKPVVPPIAAAAHVSGPVVVRVVVGKTGEVQLTGIVSGPAMLQQASIDAARKWSFLPLTVGARTVPYELRLVFTFYPPIGSGTMPGAVKMAP
jgi:TonB family protein